VFCALGGGVEVIRVVVVGVAAALERGVQGVLEFALAGRRRRREGGEGRVTGGRGGKVSVVSVGEESMAKSLWVWVGWEDEPNSEPLTASSRRSWPSRPYAIVVVVGVSSLWNHGSTKPNTTHTHTPTYPSILVHIPLQPKLPTFYNWAD